MIVSITAALCGAIYYIVQSLEDNASKLASYNVEEPKLSTALGKNNEADPQVMELAALKKKLSKPNRFNRLALSYNKLSDNSLALIADTPWIHVLNLARCEISNSGLGQLAKLSLSEINLTDSNFNDEGAKNLAACSELSVIHAGRTELSDEGVRALASIKHLKSLQISLSNITDSSLVTLAKFKELKDLGLKGVKRITNQGLVALEPTHLQVLILESTPIDDLGMVHIAKMKYLKEIILDKSKVTANGIKELSKSKSIEVISLAESPNITTNEIQSLSLTYPKIHFISMSKFSGEAP